MSKYLIVGTGGVGGSIAGFLALAGEDVTCIARGEHLREINDNGLHLKSGLKGELYVKINAVTAEDYSDKADVIIVSVKQYSLNSVKDVIKKAAHADTLVLPVLNVFDTGSKLSRIVPDVTILDGCIYIVGFVSAPGEITQLGNTFRIVLGARKESPVSKDRLQDITTTMRDAGIKVDVSDDISKETFKKWSFISAMACTGAYYDCTMGALHSQGEERNTFIGLSRESGLIAEHLGLNLYDNIEEHIAQNLNVIDHVAPESTASMQKDLKRGSQSEIAGLLFDMIDLGLKAGIDMPTYNVVASKFQEYK